MSRIVNSQTEDFVKKAIAKIGDGKYPNARESEEARLRFLEIVFDLTFPEHSDAYEAWKKREEEL